MTPIRAEFEKWHYEHRLASWNLSTISDKPDPMPDGWGLHDKEHMWQAYQAGHKAAVPEGFKVVPSKPTDSMLGAGLRHVDGIASMSSVYKAMLSAAPTPTKG